MYDYSKAILTCIAALLAVIAVGVWAPILGPSFPGYRPTMGDMMNLRDIQDANKRREMHAKLLRMVPLVNVNNTVDVNVENTVEVQGVVELAH